MKLIKKITAFSAALLAVCFMFTSCAGKPEDNGVADAKDMKITSIEDLEGKAVAVQLRSESDELVTGGKLTNYVKRYENMETAAKDLVDKKVAAMVVDSNYAKKLVADNESLAIVNNVSVGQVEYRYAALAENGGAELMAKFNNAILAFHATESYNAIINDELLGGEKYVPAKEDGKELSGTVTLMADPYFKPFIYEQDSAFKGLFVSIAENLAYSYGANFEIKKVEPGQTLTALEGTENSFAVVSGEVDAEKYAVSDVVYTSELVIVVRSDNSN